MNPTLTLLAALTPRVSVLAVAAAATTPSSETATTTTIARLDHTLLM
jgi:hypothetical protein